MLEYLLGAPIPATWNALYLKFYYIKMFSFKTMYNFLHWSYFPKEGSGQACFDDAP